MMSSNYKRKADPQSLFRESVRHSVPHILAGMVGYCLQHLSRTYVTEHAAGLSLCRIVITTVKVGMSVFCPRLWLWPLCVWMCKSRLSLKAVQLHSTNMWKHPQSTNNLSRSWGCMKIGQYYWHRRRNWPHCSLQLLGPMNLPRMANSVIVRKTNFSMPVTVRECL